MRSLSFRTRVALFVALAASSALVVTACGPIDATCQANCAVEAECGLRSEEDCLAASCEPFTGLPLAPAADACLAAATDCGAAAACACSDGCAKIDSCAESEDAACPETCALLVEQAPEQTYQENRCRIESDCEDIAACTSVGP